MINLDCFYEDHTIPLKKIEQIEMVPGKTYLTLDGSRIRITDERDVELINNSPLVDGEYINSLSNKGLELFFKLIGK